MCKAALHLRVFATVASEEAGSRWKGLEKMKETAQTQEPAKAHPLETAATMHEASPQKLPAR
mgnify:CR=1 FL=1